MALTASLQFRTTLDQAGRVAGLAGELEISESEVLRLLLDRALDVKPNRLLAQLRQDLAEHAPREATEAEIAAHEEDPDAILDRLRGRGSS